MTSGFLSATHLSLLGGGLIAVSALAVGLARSFAIKKALLDQPNARSSHRVPVPRLGGAAFVPLLLLTLGIVWWLWPSASVPAWCFGSILLGAVGLYAISLLDDVRSLPSGVRFAVQFICASMAVWTCLRLPVVALGIPAGVVLVIAIVGALNIYNFMDGIDGIAGTQAVAGGLAWSVIAASFDAPAVAVNGVAIASAAAGFLIHNWPPAKIFMGDAGSTVLGFLLAMLPLLLTVETRGGIAPIVALSAGALVLWPFLADGTFTILRRLRNGENIFQAHRSHLYQRLVIAGRPHRQVTLVYGAFAVLGCALAWCVATGQWIGASPAVGVMLLCSLVLWGWTLRTEAAARARSGAPARRDHAA